MKGALNVDSLDATGAVNSGSVNSGSVWCTSVTSSGAVSSGSVSTGPVGCTSVNCSGNSFASTRSQTLYNTFTWAGVELGDGGGATYGGYHAVAMGWTSCNANYRGIAIGRLTSAVTSNSNYSSVCIGHASSANGHWSNAIGYQCYATHFQSTVIGKTGTSSASNELTFAGFTTIRQGVAVIHSDLRDKTDIEDFDLGLEYIKLFRPRSFRWDPRDRYRDGEPDGTKKDEDKQIGLVAQEVQEMLQATGTEWTQIVRDKDPEKLYVNYGTLTFILVNAVKELSSQNEQLRADLDALQSRVDTLEG